MILTVQKYQEMSFRRVLDYYIDATALLQIISLYLMRIPFCVQSRHVLRVLQNRFCFRFPHRFDLVAFIALHTGCPAMQRQTVMARVGLIMAWWLDAYPLGSDTSCMCIRWGCSVCVHRASININQIVQTWYWRLLYVVIDVIMTRHAWRAWQILNYSHRRQINCKITRALYVIIYDFASNNDSQKRKRKYFGGTKF